MAAVTGLKIRMDIEAALRWAFREELPKTGALNRDEIDVPRHPGLATRDRDEFTTTVQMLIDMPTNCFGVLQQIGAIGRPHPDAILIGDAVHALDGMALDVPENWKPLAEMDDLSPEVTRLLGEVAARVKREIDGGTRLFGQSPSMIVRRHALAGNAPAWQATVPAVKMVSQNGMPKWFVMRPLRTKAVGKDREVIEYLEEDGFDQKGRRPQVGAYRKTFLDPDPEPAIRARAEYELWHAALNALTEDLTPRLTTIELSSTSRPATPWVEGYAPPPILPDLADMGPFIPFDDLPDDKRPYAFPRKKGA